MSLEFVAFVPHSPLLIETVGGKKPKDLKATKNAFSELSDQLIEADLDALVVISPHVTEIDDAFVMHLRPEYNGSLKMFGDFSTILDVRGDLVLMNQIQKVLRHELPLAVGSETELDHGITIPLLLLLKTGQKIPIAPFGYSGLSWQEHWEFGQALGKLLHKNYRRLGLVVSGDLSHSLSKESPAGYHQDGEKYDQTILELIDNGKLDKLFKLSPELVDNAQQCSFRALLILGGILDGQNYKANVMVYETAQGVGYLTAKFFKKS